ncbi:PQ-loop domain-containing transporter [Mycoplasma elephantis]|uniref:PQ-loop domain-containing transporter n=1 Tax=Mycoplasma elephantis TaxID=114882 RepID=UPI000484F0A3|nr:PQ-loop domain-containing transporter [Mycoplasma elephantis]
MEIINIINQVVGWLAAVITVIIGLPQLIKLLKTKNSSGISLISNWLFFIGLICWTTYGSFAFENGKKLYQTAVPNALSTMVYGMMLFLVYKYSKNINSKKIIFIGSLIALLTLLNTISFTIGMIKTDWGFQNQNAKLICSIITGALTTFAFTPQTLQSIIYKDVKNVSIGMMLILVTLNLLWIVFWSTIYSITVLMFLIYQVISLVLSLTMLIICLIYKNKNETQVA